MKNDKGITLIALVITIIVLLILAGTVIGQLTGDNGMINRTKDSAKIHYDEKEKEEIGMALSSWQLAKMNPKNQDVSFREFMEEELGDVLEEIDGEDEGPLILVTKSEKAFLVTDSSIDLIEENIDAYTELISENILGNTYVSDAF